MKRFSLLKIITFLIVVGIIIPLLPPVKSAVGQEASDKTAEDVWVEPLNEEGLEAAGLPPNFYDLPPEERGELLGAGVIHESCGWFSFDIACGIRVGISYIGEFFKQTFGVGLWIVGGLFDVTIDYSIARFSDIGNSSTVNRAWTTLRDTANLFFIFILLYAAIGMILQLPSVDGRRILVSVILVAILINFSAFFTKIVIDVSNVAAYQFYKSVSVEEASYDIGFGLITIRGLSARFMSALPLAQDLAKPSSEVGFGAGMKDAFINSSVIAFATIIMMIIAIFIFLVVSILFTVRTITLVFMIVLSPLAFLMYAFPNQKGLYDKWWDTLLKQAFFAPLFLLMVYVVLVILGPPGGLQEILQSENPSSIQIFFHFAIAAGLMLGALIIAKQLGAKGASMAMKGAGKITAGGLGFMGRQTAGRLGRRFAESETAARWAAKGGAAGWAGRLALRGAEKTSKSSFDLRGSKLAKTGVAELGLSDTLGGGKAQKGGFEAGQEAKRKEAERVGKKIKTKLGNKAADEYAEKMYKGPGAAGASLTGAAAGTAIGSLIIPGAGTAIGAAAGGGLGWLYGGLIRGRRARLEAKADEERRRVESLISTSGKGYGHKETVAAQARLRKLQDKINKTGTLGVEEAAASYGRFDEKELQKAIEHEQLKLGQASKDYGEARLNLAVAKKNKNQQKITELEQTIEVAEASNPQIAELKTKLKEIRDRRDKRGEKEKEESLLKKLKDEVEKDTNEKPGSSDSKKEGE